MKIKREYENKKSCETERSKENDEKKSEKEKVREKENEKSENNGEVESPIKKEIQKENDKRKDKEESKEKEEEESFCVKQRDMRVLYCSNQPLLELECKKICFATNEINFSLPSVNVSLLHKFKEEFPKTVHNQRAKIEGRIFFKSGGMMRSNKHHQGVRLVLGLRHFLSKC